MKLPKYLTFPTTEIENVCNIPAIEWDNPPMVYQLEYRVPADHPHAFLLLGALRHPENPVATINMKGREYPCTVKSVSSCDGDLIFTLLATNEG